MIRLKVDNQEFIDFSQRLSSLSKSAVPIAIKDTLNQTGLSMKTKAIPKFAKLAFEERQPNFFKANSRVEFANGLNVSAMVTTVGFVSQGLHNSNTNYAVRDLEQQEHAGTIHGRSYKPLPAARKGGKGNVRPNARISQILKAGNVINANDSKGQNKMQEFIKASIHAGIGGYVQGGKILWRVKNLKRKGRNTRFKMEKLYSFKKSGVAVVHATGFVKKAAVEVQKEMEFLYALNAKKQYERVLRK